MQTVYERTCLIITEFDTEDVIVTSGASPVVTPTEAPVILTKQLENSYRSFGSLSAPGDWFD